MRALSLPVRIALVLFGGLIAVQAMALFGVLYARAQDTGGVAWPLPDRLAALVELFETADAPTRALALRTLNGGAAKVALLDDFPGGGVRRAPIRPIGEAFARPYTRRLGDRDLRILMRAEGQNRPLLQALLDAKGAPDSTRFAFAVCLATGEVLLFDPGAGARRQAFSTAMLIVNLVAATLVTAIVLHLVLSHLRPLNAIAGQAQAFAGDLDAPPMPEAGPREARAVAGAFNEMRAQTLALIAARTRMLAAIAHDLKTYITRLRLRVALIEDDAQRDKADADIAEIAALIDDSLLVARGESAHAERTPFAVGAWLGAVLAQRSDPRLTLGPTAEDLEAVGAPGALQRVVDNLLDNALAYAGGAVIEARLGGRMVTIDVLDRGPGLCGADPEELFEPFVRGERSRNRATGGSGLGLSIARTLARQSGGDVVLAEREGGGLLARITIPAASTTLALTARTL